jgi:acyl-[acyl carrier protein]--UDP-N-acetylglucosamine O-acyltransferase
MGMQRRGFSEVAIRAAKLALRKLYREKLKLADAMEQLAEIDDPHGVIDKVTDFVSESERGIH